jgi:hypothetical protein
MVAPHLIFWLNIPVEKMTVVANSGNDVEPLEIGSINHSVFPETYDRYFNSFHITNMRMNFLATQRQN